MGTSLVDYHGNGFWTPDALVESLLALLVIELEPRAPARPWLQPILDWWTVQAIGGFGGCVSPDLDRHLEEPEAVELVTAAAHRLPPRVRGDQVVTITTPRFEVRARRLWESDDWDRPRSPAPWLLRVTETFVDLLDGRLEAPLDRALFLAEDETTFLNGPPAC